MCIHYLYDEYMNAHEELCELATEGQLEHEVALCKNREIEQCKKLRFYSNFQHVCFDTVLIGNLGQIRPIC